MLNQRSRKARKASALPCENPYQIISVEGTFPEVSRFGEAVADAGYPPPWSIEISDLRRILELIYGLQSLRGKILSRKGLAAGIGISRNVAVFFLY
jgi:hypothetical protein